MADKKASVSVHTVIGGPSGSSTHKAARIILHGADESSAQTVEVAVGCSVTNRGAALAAAQILRRAADELDGIAARPWPGKRETGEGKRRGPGRPRKDETAKAARTSAKKRGRPKKTA